MIVLINYRKINHQQKNMFIRCKKLNGPILKSLKSKLSRVKSAKNWPSRPIPRFCILFSAKARHLLKFYVYFMPGLKNLAHADRNVLSIFTSCLIELISVTHDCSMECRTCIFFLTSFWIGDCDDHLCSNSKKKFNLFKKMGVSNISD